MRSKGMGVLRDAVLGMTASVHRMGRNHLLGTIGDAIDALAAACGYNLQRILMPSGILARSSS